MGGIPEETLPKREIVVSAALKLTSQLLPFFLQESRDGRGKGEALLSVMSGHLTSDARGKKEKRDKTHALPRHVKRRRRERGKIVGSL